MRACWFNELLSEVQQLMVMARERAAAKLNTKFP